MNECVREHVSLIKDSLKTIEYIQERFPQA